MDDKRKDHPDPKSLPKKQLLTHNVSTDDMENTNGTNLGGDLQFAKKPRIVPGGIERIPQMDQRYRRDTSNWSMRPEGE